MSSVRNRESIQIGLVCAEPIRLEGLLSIFEQPVLNGNAPLVPVACTLPQILACSTLEYVVIDMHESPGRLEDVVSIHHARPALQIIVIGPEGNDEFVMQAIISGARAYLDPAADEQTVRHALETVTSGSIWAPRRLLSKLIDRLLKVPDSASSISTPRLTDREKDVLALILKARSNREIADELGIEERTVKAHVGRLMRKTGSDNRVELTMRTLNRPLLRSAGSFAGPPSQAFYQNAANQIAD